MAPPFTMMVMKAFIQDIEDEELGNFISDSAWSLGTSNIGSINRKYDPDAGDTLIFVDGVALTATGTLHNAIDGSTNLQVPTGKKWTVVLTIGFRVTTGPTFKIRGSATVDTADGNTHYTQTKASVTNEKVTTPVLTLAADEFLTYEVTANTATFLGATIIESDA